MWEDGVIFMCGSRRSDTEAPVGPPRAMDRSVADVPAGDRSPVGRAMRASDRDREAVVALLGEHTAAGRLTLAEFEERVGAATAARTLADLDRLLVDLPVAPPPRHPVASDRRHERWRPWLSTAVLCIVIWAATSLLAREVIYFWPFWVIVPWGVVLIAGGRSVPGRRQRVR